MPTWCLATSTKMPWPRAPCCSSPKKSRRAIKTRIAGPLGRELMETAYGIHTVANANMMHAVKSVTIYRGRDPRDFALLAFGGSGGVHAVSLRAAAAD